MYIFFKKDIQVKRFCKYQEQVKILNDACLYNVYVIDYKLILGILSEYDREMIFGYIYYIYVYLIFMCL